MLRNPMFTLVGVCLIAILHRSAMGQANSAADGLALKVWPQSSTLRIDARLIEADWRAADSIAGLTQVEPQEGASASARTVVRVIVARDALVVGVIAEDPDPARIVSFARARDASLEREDHVRLVLDPFLDGRSGYVFAVNVNGARYDALVSERGESEDDTWDAVWEAAAVRTATGWSAELRIPVQSLIFPRDQRVWGFNIERRIQRLQETDRWAGARRDYQITHTSHAGRLTGMPSFDIGLGLTIRPSLLTELSRPNHTAATTAGGDVALDASQRVTPNLLATLTVNTDFAETEVDSRQTNLTRFPLFFPEKRAFFLEGADLFDFGLGLGTDIIPFFTRRIGLVAGQEVPLVAGLKATGRVAGTNLGALAIRTDRADLLVPATTLGVVRIKQNLLRESSVGIIATAGDPLGRSGSWLGGADFTFQTSRFAGNKNFLVGVSGLMVGRDQLGGDRTAFAAKIDYPNDLWDIAFTYKRIGDAFDPSLGFVPRRNVNLTRLSVTYAPRPQRLGIRQMFHEFVPVYATDLRGRWESYRVFMAPLNWRMESGDRFEANVVPEGEQLRDTFEVAEGVQLAPGQYHWVRYRLEAEFAAKRPVSGQVTWWFGGFFGGTLHQIITEGSWKPSALVAFDVNLERNIGRLPAGSFTTNLVGLRLRLNWSPDLSLSSLVQYDDESRSLGTNTRLRWTFSPRGDVFVVYNHNARDMASNWSFDSNQLLVKAQYAWRR